MSNTYFALTCGCGAEIEAEGSATYGLLSDSWVRIDRWMDDHKNHALAKEVREVQEKLRQVVADEPEVTQ